MHIKEMHFKLLQYCCNQLFLNCFTIMISIQSLMEGRRVLYFGGYVINMKVLPFANLYFPIRMFLFRSSRSLICIFVFSFDFPVYWIAVRRNSSMKLSSLTTLAMMVSNICDLWKNICFVWLKHLANTNSNIYRFCKTIFFTHHFITFYSWYWSRVVKY